jgi:Family of unknown function (DUF6494)
MDEELFNIELRKFLKTFGVTAQREIEKAVQHGIESRRLVGGETLRVRARLEIEGLGETVAVDGAIRLA